MIETFLKPIGFLVCDGQREREKRNKRKGS